MSFSSPIKLVRAGLGSLTVGALGYQYWKLQKEPDFLPATFFSYFTVESNLAAAAMLLWGATDDQERRDATTVDLLRGAATLYMAITGIVYAALLAGNAIDEEAPPGRDDQLVDMLVHQIMPVVMTVDWLVVPPQNRLAYRRALIWLAGPLAFAGYSLVRGPRVDWYPYPFLDPRQPGGYRSIALYSAGIAVGSAAFTGAIVAVGNWRRSRQMRQKESENLAAVEFDEQRVERA